MKHNSFFSLFRVNFLTGLAVVTPGAISIGLIYWLFGTISNFTDFLLFFLPHKLTHALDADGKIGSILWYWSLAALVVAVILVALTGHFARYYLGRQAIALADHAIMQVPLLNKIYSTLKQVNEAFSSNKSSFKLVVLVAFPHPGARSVGFVTGEHTSIPGQTETLVSVFIPTTPNPTSGFMILVPERELVKLDMSVPDGIKFIISLGAISPVFGTSGQPAQIPPLK